MGDATGREVTGQQDSRDLETAARRAFLRKVGRAGMAVPAVALLLAASAERSSADPGVGSGGSGSGSS